MLVERFLGYIKVERRYSKATTSAYAGDIRRFLNDLKETSNSGEEELDPCSVHPDDIRDWIVGLTEKGLAPTSVNRMTCSLRAFYRWLRKAGLVEVDPFLHIGLQRTSSKLPSYIPENEMLAMVNQPVPDNFEGERNALIIMLFYATGIRLAELLRLRRSDLSSDYGELRVLGKGNKERIIPLLGQARERVRDHVNRIRNENICELPDNSLFLTMRGAPLSRAMIYHIVKNRLAGVQGKNSPHVLRHSFATHMLNEGADMREIQEILGHNSLAATQVYTHNTITHLKEIYRGAHPRGK